MKKPLDFQAYRNFLPSKKMMVRFMIYGLVLGAVLWWLAYSNEEHQAPAELPQEIDLEGIEF